MHTYVIESFFSKIKCWILIPFNWLLPFCWTMLSFHSLFHQILLLLSVRYVHYVLQYFITPDTCWLKVSMCLVFWNYFCSQHWYMCGFIPRAFTWIDIFCMTSWTCLQFYTYWIDIINNGGHGLNIKACY